jgi:hypothetical protein
MKVKIVPRSKIKVSRNSTSKYQSLINALEKLKPGGDAIQVKYSDTRELNSMRNIVYTINKEKGMSIKSNTDTEKKLLYLYLS